MLGVTEEKIREHTDILQKNRDLIKKDKAQVDQIVSNDVHRSFVHFEDYNSYSQENLADKKLDLKTILHTLLQS